MPSVKQIRFILSKVKTLQSPAKRNTISGQSFLCLLRCAFVLKHLDILEMTLALHITLSYCFIICLLGICSRNVAGIYSYGATVRSCWLASWSNLRCSLSPPICFSFLGSCLLSILALSRRLGIILLPIRLHGLPLEFSKLNMNGSFR